MPLQLTPGLEATVERMMAAGDYEDPSAVLFDALRLLDDEIRFPRLQASLIEAEEQTNRGEIIEWTPEARRQVQREAVEMYRRGERPDPEVCP